MPPEQPSAAHQNIERGKEAPQSDLSKALTSFSHSLHHNDNFPVVTDTDSEQELLQKEDALTRDGKYDSAKEFYLTSKIIRQRDSIQQEKALKESSGKKEQKLIDYAVAHVALAYNEYFLMLLEQTESVMKDYQKERELVTGIPPALEEKEKEAANFMLALTFALDERREFATARLSDYMLRSARGNPSELRRNIQQFTDPSVLRPDSLAAFNGGDTTAMNHGNKLDQQIINILAGNATITGVSKGFKPGTLYFSLLSFRYNQLLAEQRKDASSGKAAATADKSTQGIDRKRVTDELMRATELLGKGNIAEAELSTLQRILGAKFNLTDALPPKKDFTPDEVRRAIAETMETRSNYHLDKIGEFTNQVNKSVLSKDLSLNLDDFWTKHGRNGVSTIAEGLAHIFSAPMSSGADVYGPTYEMTINTIYSAIGWPTFNQLTDPITNPMGWPKGKSLWIQLTEDEKNIVRKKSKSILDAIQSFDKTTIIHLNETTSLIKSMPPAPTLADQAATVPQELPQEKIHTQEELQKARKEYGDATVYCMLFEQLDKEWGSSDTGEGFMGEYVKFYGSLEEVINTKIDVGRGMIGVANGYGKIGKGAAWLAIFGLVGGGVALWLAWKASKFVVKKTVQKTVEAGAKGTRAGLDALRKSVSKGTNPAPTGVAAEAEALKDIETIIAKNAPKTASKLGKAVKILGTAGFIFTVGMTGKEIYERLDEQTNLAPIKDEQERINAALAFLESPEAKRTLNTDAAYNRAVNLLTDRLQSIISLRDALKIVPDLPDSVDPTQKSALIQMQTKVLAKQGQLLQDAQQVHNYCAKRMPIDDLMSKDTRTGQYKVDVGGGIGIFSGGKLQDAMQVSDPKAPSALSMEQELDIGLLRRNLEKQTEDYTESLKEYLNVLAAAIK